ncbi:MAG: nucleoside triphosphate pyrophosphohydrolase [Clostridia bacterium]|nr:nucleoside triphosphate pyrophosphohydrolase [Clostridia bacterium]
MEGPNETYTIGQLLKIMKTLRSPNGCPWDREQTHKSIRNDALEEVYEVADAIDNDDSEALCEELGDMLLQVVFHSCIAEEENEFTFEDVVDGICKKLVLRHPHVFGEANVENSSEVLDLWDSIKKQEKKQTTVTDTLESVPKAFPSLMRAAKVQKRARKANVSLENPQDELNANCELLKQAISSGDKELINTAYSACLFNLAGMGQALGINAEEALNNATNSFIENIKQAELNGKLF